MEAHFGLFKSVLARLRASGSTFWVGSTVTLIAAVALSKAEGPNSLSLNLHSFRALDLSYKMWGFPLKIFHALGLRDVGIQTDFAGGVEVEGRELSISTDLRFRVLGF